MSENSFDKELLLSNLLGASTLDELFEKEKIITGAKMLHLLQYPIKGNLNYQHLKEIHYFLFCDIYIWAGKDRYEAGIKAKFGKGRTLFTPYDKLGETAQRLFDALRTESFFKGQSKKDFTRSAAIFMNGLNILHPFREGNGRVQRIFMQYVAENAGYELSFNDISEKEMIEASVKGAEGVLAPMIEIFQKSLK
jgi:cell filamentation protein